MDSWTLQGDSYSFLRSAPRNFSLCHRDGTPNHVEIFDIINVPAQRSAISETTCLCDIFGDDCETQSLSSSPAVVAFVPTQRELDVTAATSPSVDDQNDSSGSYHTAPGSSEGEEGSEDSRDRFHSPLLQGEFSEKRQSDNRVTASGQAQASEYSSPNLQTNTKSPVPQQSKADLSFQVTGTDQRTPTPGNASPCTVSPEGRLSSLSSSSFEKRHSASSPDSRQINSEGEQSTIITSEDRHSSASHTFLTPSPSLELRNCVNLSSPESANTRLFPASLSQNSSPLLAHTFEDFAGSNFESQTYCSPSPFQSKLSSSRETPVSPGLSDTLSFPDTQASSPFPELRGRVSLPDLLSRGSTPDIENFTRTAELTLTAGRDISPSPVGQNKKLSPEPGSNISTPAPRHTPPSPVISVTASPVLVESTASPEFRNTDHSPPSSPSLLSVASSAKARTGTPSHDPSPDLTFSEGRTQLSSPVASYSLSPSPGIRESYSPAEYRYTSPSPEIRITASSPQFNREELSPSLPEPHTNLTISGSVISSPQISGISYSVVQPEDRHSPPFPELSHLSTPEPGRTHTSTDTPIESISTPVSVRSISLSEINKPGEQTPSPQLNFRTPSPGSRIQALSPDKYQSPSPQSKSRESSPVCPLSGHNYQHSPATLSGGYSPHCTQSVTSLRSTPEVEGDCCDVGIADEQSHRFLAKDNVSSSCGPPVRDNLGTTEIKNSSPTVFLSPVSISPVSREKSRNKSPKQRGTERKESSTDINSQNQSSTIFVSEVENQDLISHFFQTEESNHHPSINLTPTDRNLSKNRSPVHQVSSNSPGRPVEILQPQLNSYSPTSENRNTFKPTYPPENSSRQLSTKGKQESRERSTEDMSRRVNRRRTPSPPLTRFTPVHIIAPEKPYRHWQNRRNSPPEVIASSPSCDLKKAVTNRESPTVASVDNNSQTPWVSPGWQLEKEMQLEQEREIGRERQRDREMRKREEQVSEKGEGWQGDASYRGEQVELSFSARNRKGPVSRTAAPTSRETRQGLPTVHSYSEGLLATRQLQQQQNLLRLAAQQETRSGGGSRRQASGPHSKSSAPRRVSTNRASRSSSSSMGSELDETDNEVKWFTDYAFRSLSSPEVDYLDMYNSSHRSSTNISQPSTQESPAGVNAAWPAYADFRGSAPKLDQDELTIQQQSAYYSDGLDPSRRYELGSYECVDVAVEREDPRKIRRGVPKRQIQLKKRNTAEGNLDESSENSSPSLPVMVESPSQESHFRGDFVRQHSTPAAIQECYPTDFGPDQPQENGKKFKLQKSASVDETSSKTKMATCLIKNVLSKKMLSVDNQPVEQACEDASPTFEENSPPTETETAPLEVSPKCHSSNQSQIHQSDHRILPEGLPLRGELSTKEDAKPPRGFGARSSNRPSSSNSSRSVNFSLTDSEEADFQSTNANFLRTEMMSELKVPFESQNSDAGVQQFSDRTSCKKDSDSANANAEHMGAPSATGARNTQVRETNKDQQCENMEDHKQLQPSDKNASMSRPQEITIKAVEKKKASLNVCLTPEAENRPETLFPNVLFKEKEDVPETRIDDKTEKEGNENTNVKAPIHKVRDVRRLVKNTYNLSFKAASSVTPSNAHEEKTGISEALGEDLVSVKKSDIEQDGGSEVKKDEKEEFWMDRREEQKQVKNLTTVAPSIQGKGKPLTGPQPIQIECKAVRWKEDKNMTSCVDNKSKGEKPQAPSSSLAEVSRETQSLNSQDYKTEDSTVVKLCEHNVSVTEETQETTTEIHKVPGHDDKPIVFKTDKKPPMLGSLPKLPSKEREVSTAVVLIREGSNKTKTSASPAQDEIPQAACLSPESMTPGGHSVSMLLKEKGYQADIGAVVGDNQNTPEDTQVPKHVNCLEIPLQTNTISDENSTDSHCGRTFPGTPTSSAPSAKTDNTDMFSKMAEDEAGAMKQTRRDLEKQKRNTLNQTPPLTRQKELGDFESVKRMDPTFPPRSPAVRRFKPQPIEVKSLSKELQKKENPPNITGSNKPQTIEVKSIAKNSQKPAVPPKPNCKFKPVDLAATPSDPQRQSATASALKLQGEERTQTIVVSSPTIYRKISSDSTSSNYSRKLAVSAVSSLKPPPSKPASACIADQSNQSTATSDPEVSNDRRQPAASSQSSSSVQTPVTLATIPTSCEGSNVNSEPSMVSDSNPSQISGPASSAASQESQTAVVDPDNHLRYSRPVYPQEQAMPPSKNMKQAAPVSHTQLPRYSHQPCRGFLSSERSQRIDDLRFYASDDPPSYDERESFSPLMLQDLTPLRSNRYQPSSRPPPCSCSSGCPSHPGPPPPHHHRSPHNLTPPAPPHSPGQPIPYPVMQPALRAHQCRPEPQPMNYQPGSPKSGPIGPNQPTIYQPLHQSASCPSHPSLMQSCPADRPIQPPQHNDPRRPAVHRSPHQQPPGMTAASYSDTGHSHSPSLPPMDPQYLCGPQSMGPSYGSEYGGDTSSLYSESSFAQAPRRVLMDPETGKYFYIEVPVQPLRKMLFDPETGQYVEVLIPQQSVSHSALYPPSAAPYPSLPNPNMYAPAPQYMPYVAPPPSTHPQAQPQPPRYPEASATATMHPSGSGVSYRNPVGQGSKPDSQTNPLDHSYLESMYYVPTGMTASPNPIPPDYYHKHPPNLPPTGGKRS